MKLKTIVKIGEKGYLKKLDIDGGFCYTDKKSDAMKFDNLEQAYNYIYDVTLYTSNEQYDITYEHIQDSETLLDDILCC